MHDSELPFQESPTPAAHAPGRDGDPELEKTADHLASLDPDGSRIAAALRRTFDMLLDGQHTGRYRWEQLYKTEKTHFGTLVEINLQREFDFDGGEVLDYLICGTEVDCKYSQKLGAWMIPPEAVDRLCLGLWASDSESRWSAGLFRAEEHLLGKGNRDAKRTLTKEGRERVRWLFYDKPLPVNVLLHLPPGNVEAVFAADSGSARVRELFRRAQGLPVRRAVVATVAQQEDYMKRVRGNGGARSALRAEGIVILGQYTTHCAIAKALGLVEPGPGEFVSARLTPADSDTAELPRAFIDGSWWRLARAEDPLTRAPLLPKV
ncbi:NaeI family type II restriction endonuclease [Nocardiopsis tropica]|uniref:NaeI family type II restriction endonuclease n=1 Tax=Nocardiopsis tropica TaxID=109330 RepID=A0ABU7KV61_9ACTN|nr:NaeI family type II restriction endonuclease [Nocardiopsis umidischolae]MEE2053154.1 NaeI family type II restriction endonuclease [Nocardiopsis umidischolae]